MDVTMYATRTMLAPTTAVKAAYVALPEVTIEVKIHGDGLDQPFQKYFNDPKYEVIGIIPRERLKNTSFAS
jgi:hypothetical protein